MRGQGYDVIHEITPVGDLDLERRDCGQPTATSYRHKDRHGELGRE